MHHRQGGIPSYCHIAILPYFHTAILPYCHSAILPFCRISILSYSPTGLTYGPQDRKTLHVFIDDLHLPLHNKTTPPSCHEVRTCNFNYCMYSLTHSLTHSLKHSAVHSSAHRRSWSVQSWQAERLVSRGRPHYLRSADQFFRQNYNLASPSAPLCRHPPPRAERVSPRSDHERDSAHVVRRTGGVRDCPRGWGADHGGGARQCCTEHCRGVPAGTRGLERIRDGGTTPLYLFSFPH